MALVDFLLSVLLSGSLMAIFYIQVCTQTLTDKSLSLLPLLILTEGVLSLLLALGLILPFLNIFCSSLPFFPK